MNDKLKMLEADRWELLVHLTMWPSDKYALDKLNLIEIAIADATPPQTSDQRQSTLRGDKPYVKASEFKFVWPADLGKKAKDITDEWKFGPVQPKEGDGATRFTFGADYEMDQRWLAAEREKAANPKMVMVQGRAYDVAHLSTIAEVDNYMFPTMAYNLTSLHNLNYGTSRY